MVIKSDIGESLLSYEDNSPDEQNISAYMGFQKYFATDEEFLFIEADA